MPLPPIVICLGKRYITNWFYNNLEGREQVVLSNTGYINEKISIDWLGHFIKYAGARPNAY